MDSGDLSVKLKESKSLNRKIIKVVNDLMTLDVFWIRVVYGENESLLTNYTKHTFYEMQYSLRGTISLIIGNNEHINIEQSKFLIVPPETYHQIIDSTEKGERFIMGFSVESGNKEIISFLDKVLKPQVYKEAPRMRQLLQLMLNSAYENNRHSNREISNLMQCFIYEIINTVCPEGNDDTYIDKKTENFLRIKEINDYITDRHGINITVEKISRHCNMSTRHVTRVCCQYAGKSPRELINAAKLKHIKLLIESTPMSLYEISEICGFSDEYAMNKFFKRYENMTLTKYKQFIQK